MKKIIQLFILLFPVLLFNSCKKNGTPTPPEPLFPALSKNNPLGYTLPDGFKREMSYIYDDNGFPAKRMNTNINPSGTYSFEETYDYECP